MKYTPGPWEVGVGMPNPGGPISRTIEYIAVRAPNGLVIALCGDANDPKMRTASENDALLISKAPAMYEALIKAQHMATTLSNLIKALKGKVPDWFAEDVKQINSALEQATI